MPNTPDNNRSEQRDKKTDGAFLKKSTVIPAIIAGSAVLLWAAYMATTQNGSKPEHRPSDSAARTPKAEDSATAAASGKDRLQEGYDLFQANCSSCHGTRGQGQIPSQPGGGMTQGGSFIAPALDSTGHAWHHPEDVLFNTVKDGSIEPTSPMRGFKDKLSDDQIKSVVFFIKSLWSSEIQNRYAQIAKQRRQKK